jgi:glucose-6-phosphate dehydrogenase assembly protein OpcA
MHNHPSRAVILRPEANAAALDARIFAECWKPFGKAQQICSEGIEITEGPSGFAEVAKFLVPLRVPDLPVVLWCRGKAALEPGPLEPLFPLADKVIFDSRDVADADSALQYLRKLRGRGIRVADLHWTRLTGWREVVAHLFDDGALALGEIKTAQVAFGGPLVTTCARYFAAWIRTALPAARVTMATVEGAPGLRSVTLSTARPIISLSRAAAILTSSIRMRPPVSFPVALYIGRSADAGRAGHPGTGSGLRTGIIGIMTAMGTLRKMDVLRYPNSVAAAEACGQRALDLLGKAIAAKSRATLAVSGGTSPRPMFELFAKSGFPWERVHIFWVDERYVPPSDPESNFRMANETWLEPANVPADHIHRVPHGA